MKRILSLLLCLVMCLSLLPAAAAEDIEIIDIETEPEEQLDLGDDDVIAIVDPELSPTEPEDEIMAGKPVITENPEDVTAYVGKTVTFRFAATGADSYQWMYRKTPDGTWFKSSAEGAETDTLTVEATLARSGFQYRCRASNAAGSVYGRPATLTVSEKPVITTQPASKTAVAGNTAKFSVKADGASSYQWQYRKNASSDWYNSTGEGAKTSALSIEATAARNGFQFRCRVTNSKGSSYSKAATLTVVSTPKVTTQPANQTVKLGETAGFTVKATGGSLKYQWQYRKNASSSWYNSTAADAKTASLSVEGTKARNGFQFRCRISNAAGTVYSNAATLTVKADKPVVTKQPADQMVKLGETARFSVTATGEGLSYQWQYRKNASSDWYNSTAADAKTASLSVEGTKARNGFQFRCRVKNAAGSVYTNAATLTVKADKPVVTKQPADQTVKLGETARFSVTATGEGLSYQWQYRKNASSDWYNSTAADAKTASLSVEGTKARNGFQFRCRVKNAAGSVYTNAATLTVKADKPVITKQPKNYKASDGTYASFRVTATGEDLSYQWYYRKSASGTWAKSTAEGAKTAAISVKVSSSKDGYQYRCKVSNAGGTVYSDAATLTSVGQITYRALLIGEVHFSWETANRNKGDVLQMNSMLSDVDAAYGGKYAVTSAYDLNNNGIRDAIRTAFAGADDNDVSLFFIATHGVVDIAGGEDAGAMVTIASPGAVDDFLTMGQLASWLKEVPGKVVVLLGSCGSGAAIVSNGGEVSFVSNDSDEYLELFNDAVIAAFEEQNEMIPVSEDGVYSNTGEFRSSKFYVLTAAAHQESSWGQEGEEIAGQYNYFTCSLVYGVTYEHLADTDHNGTMTLKEVYKYVYDNSLGPYRDGGRLYYQHVQVYPSNSSYPLFRYNLNGPVITEQPRNYIASKGVTVTIKVEAEGAESYQWQWRKNPSECWTSCELSGNQTASLKVKATYTNDKYSFRCVVSGPGGVTVSNAVHVSREEAFDDTHKWWMDSKGNLSITGTGPIPDDCYTYWRPFAYVPRFVTIGSGTTYIGSNLFKGCYNMETIKLPDTVTGIGDRAFDGCKLLHTLRVPKNLTSVGSYAFNDCGDLYLSLDSVSLREIGEYAFSGCHLQSVKLAGDLTAIPDRAFVSCRDLRSVEIPESVTVIGSGAFSDCTGLTGIVIPDGVTVIGSAAFYGCPMTEIAIPNGVTEIGSAAFANCDSLTSLTVPDSVVNLGDECFINCDRLKTVNIGKGVKNLNENMFTNCYELETIKVASGNAKYASYNGALLNKYKKTLILCPKGMTGALTLPSTLTTVKDTALRDCRKLESITIPDGVTSLPDSCFNDCWALTEVQFGSGIEEITASLFYGCPALESITVSSGNANYASSGGVLLNKAKTTLLFCPKGKSGAFTIPSTVKTIGDSAFYQCDKLTSVTIPSSVTKIGYGAFTWCTGLTAVTIPDSVTSVGEHAFNSCSAITSVKLGKGLTAIAESMFNNCSSLTSVTIPSTVKTIGEYAFYNCDLREVRLSKAVTSIGDFAFANNLNLSDVYYTGTKTQWNKIAFGEYNDALTNATIHYNASLT